MALRRTGSSARSARLEVADPYEGLTGLARRKAVTAARAAIVAERLQRAWDDTVRAFVIRRAS